MHWSQFSQHSSRSLLFHSKGFHQCLWCTHWILKAETSTTIQTESTRLSSTQLWRRPSGSQQEESKNKWGKVQWHGPWCACLLSWHPSVLHQHWHARRTTNIYGGPSQLSIQSPAPSNHCGMPLWCQLCPWQEYAAHEPHINTFHELLMNILHSMTFVPFKSHHSCNL